MSSETPGAFVRGLVLISTTVLFWGMLSIALVFALQTQDGVTITWFRFVVAAIACLAFQAARGKLGEYRSLTGRDWGILLIAGVLLIADYVGYILALNYISPAANQIFAQATPFFMAMGGIIFFRERLSGLQMLCFAGLIVGLLMFFNSALVEMTSEAADLAVRDKFIIGAVIAIVASFLWACYAMLQKLLASRISSTNIFLFIYLLAIVVLLPLSDLESFTRVSAGGWGILLFCALNTLVAYGSFGESLKYWPATHISSVVAATPLVTIFCSYFAHRLWPDDIAFPTVNTLGWAGVALTLVCMVLFNMRRKPKPARDAVVK
ncbi:MAG: DMT family transporter [Alphaproteobacteria bacterium]|nr:MAG: DMT family transporter [Alphaproteobacteria bacterium]